MYTEAPCLCQCLFCAFHWKSSLLRGFPKTVYLTISSICFSTAFEIVTLNWLWYCVRGYIYNVDRVSRHRTTVALLFKFSFWIWCFATISPNSCGSFIKVVAKGANVCSFYFTTKWRNYRWIYFEWIDKAIFQIKVNDSLLFLFTAE